MNSSVICPSGEGRKNEEGECRKRSYVDYGPCPFFPFFLKLSNLEGLDVIHYCTRNSQEL